MTLTVVVMMFAATADERLYNTKDTDGKGIHISQNTAVMLIADKIKDGCKVEQNLKQDKNGNYYYFIGNGFVVKSDKGFLAEAANVVIEENK